MVRLFLTNALILGCFQSIFAAEPEETLELNRNGVVAEAMLFRQDRPGFFGFRLECHQLSDSGASRAALIFLDGDARQLTQLVAKGVPASLAPKVGPSSSANEAVVAAYVLLLSGGADAESAKKAETDLLKASQEEIAAKLQKLKPGERANVGGMIVRRLR